MTVIITGENLVYPKGTKIDLSDYKAETLIKQGLAVLSDEVIKDSTTEKVVKKPSK